LIKALWTGRDGRARSCVATAFKIPFELGDPAHSAPQKVFGLADDPMGAAYSVSVEGQYENNISSLGFGASRAR
jgi:hypothetical protein